MIPIVIISHNNYRYVKNTIQQFENINKQYLTDIIIFDNLSTDEETIKYLTELKLIKVIFNQKNEGPWITDSINSDIYNTLPNRFILTDPDLEFNKNLNSNFIEEILNLSIKYNC